MEFTIEHQKLDMLQCQNDKRTGQAAIKMAVNLVHEDLFTEADAVLRIELVQVENIID